MTNTIQVPRELLERATFPYTGVETIHTTRQIALDDIRALLRAAPAAEVERLEVVAWMTTADKDGPKTAVTMSLEASRQQHSNWLRQSRSITTEPLCSLPKAQAVIEQYKQDALRYRWLRYMTTKERVYIVQQAYDKDMDNLLDQSMKGECDE